MSGTQHKIGPHFGTRFFGVTTAPILMPLLQARRGRLAVLVLLGLVGAAMALVPPWLTKLVIDQGLMAQDADALILWSLALFVFGLLALALGALSSIVHMRASVSMLADLRAGVVEAVLRRSPKWRAGFQTGELMARVDGDAAAVQQFAFNALLTGSGAIVRLLGGALLLFVLNWKLAILACLLAPIELAFLAWARPKTEDLAENSRAAKGSFSGQLAELLALLPGLKAIRAEPVMAHRLATAQKGLNTTLIKAHQWGEFTRAVPQILSAIVRGSVFVIGGLAVIRGDWPLGSLIAFLAYLGFLTGPVQSLTGLWHAHAKLQAALTRLGALLGPDAQAPTPITTQKPVTLKLTNVTHEGLFSPVTADIPSGTALRLSGPSGVGKSTLMAILAGLEPAVSGLSINGVALSQIPQDSLRRFSSYVPQRPVLIRGTVAENLRLSAPNCDDMTLMKRLKLVELNERFGPEGLSAMIGEHGMTLSGGERQRLCLARAMVDPAPMLLMDEALSEVDPATCSRIMARIHIGWPTLTRIIVTHSDAQSHGPFDSEITLHPW